MSLREIMEEKKHSDIKNRENNPPKSNNSEPTLSNGDILLPYGSSIYEFKLYISSDLCRRLEADDFWFSEMLLNADIIYEGELNLAQLIDEIVSVHESNDRVGIIALLSNSLIEIKIVIKNRKSGIIAYSKDAVIICGDVFDLIPEKVKGNVIIGIVLDSLD
ncbi:MAG: hypothetical protein F7C81_01960 [Desulfurococcales archaeon]|nr:hypothetical protein [Desulfurococcales archaeon]